MKLITKCAEHEKRDMSNRVNIKTKQEWKKGRTEINKGNSLTKKYH